MISAPAEIILSEVEGSIRSFSAFYQRTINIKNYKLSAFA